MCIIMYKEPGKAIKDEWMDNSAESNADGFGLSYVHPDYGVTTYKTMDYENFKKEFRRLEARHSESSFVLHFRKTTDGATDVDNCHPFEVGGLAVFHNGMITACKPADKDDKRSDTRIFCEEVLSNLQNGWYDNEATLDLIEHYIGNSKLAIMDGGNGVTILNEDKGHWYEGIWMSNYSYYPNTRSVQKYKPHSWNANKHKTYDKKGGKDKTICYEHPDGTFTKYMDGRRFRWFPGYFMWAPIKESGEREYAKGGSCFYNDAPTTYFYRIIDVDYGIDLREVPRALRIVKKAEEMHMCDWCGEYVKASDLQLYNWDEDSPDDEASLLCPFCREELGAEAYMYEMKNANLEYYLHHRSDGIWGV